MVITYHGGDCFKITQGELTLALNPVSKTSADVTLFTTGRNETSEKSGFVVDGPGEYEIKDIFIKGFLSDGPEGQINTIYMISFEGMNLCFLGALTNPAMPTKTLEAMENVDILFVPIAEKTMEPAPAYKLAVSLEPSIIIPMYYSSKSSEEVKQFLKEGGADKIEPI